MLMLNLQAQLGNQMFQYAAVRTLAENRGVGFAFRGEPLPWKEHVRHALGLPRRNHPVTITKYFELGGEPRWRNRLKQAYWRLRPDLPRSKYKGKYSKAFQDYWISEFDPEFANLPDGSEVQAWLQSERYFADNRAAVLAWFTPKPPYRRRIEELDRRVQQPAERRCCLHIRRSDYKQASNNGHAGGWSLPISYYRHAVEQLPQGLFYVLTSDEPDWVAEHFSWLQPQYISRGESPVVDMFWMTRCQYNIIANSTFSWWGAWLNQLHQRVVIAPKYFVGWARGVWNPSGIEVPEWSYVSVQS